MPRVSPDRSAQSSRVLLRLPAELHQRLTREAAECGVSFNAYCVQRLGAAPVPVLDEPLSTEVLLRAHARFGDHLAGVLLLGSWARGEAATTSDIDVLVVVDREVVLTRELYREWDSEPLLVAERTVDVHFVHVPAAGTSPTALWCEAAVDGRIWYDRDGAIGRHLADARRAMAEGRVVRATVHGQPYWKGAA
jgi:predicted nucleotidyltransferase